MKTIAFTFIALIVMNLPAENNPTPELNSLTDAYLRIKNALVEDKPEKARAEAGEFLQVLKSLPQTFRKGPQAALISEMERTATSISITADIAGQRDFFKLLSEAFYALIGPADHSDRVLYRQYCPMKKAYWISAEKEIRNPFYGSKMLTCGSVKEVIR